MKNIRKKFVRRDTEPAMTISHDMTKKTQQDMKTRRKSEGLLKIPDTIIENIPKTMPPKYYFQGLEREGAELLLKSEPVGTFLVRDRQSSALPGSYTLSLRDKDDAFRHYRIETNQRNQKLVLQTYQGSHFDSLESLVEFFIKKQQNFDAPLKPFIVCGTSKTSTTDCIYEEMDQNNDLYTEIGGAQVETSNSVVGRRSPSPNPPLPTSPSYQSCYENMNKVETNNSVVGRRSTSPNPLPTSPSYQSFYENMNKVETSNSVVGRRSPSPRGHRPPPEPPKSSSTTYENLPAHNGGFPTPTSHSSVPPCLPPKPPSPAYQNLPSKFSPPQIEEDEHYIGPKGGHRLPPPSTSSEIMSGGYENVPGKNRTFPPQFKNTSQSGVYENCPGKDEAVPLPPRPRQLPITGTDRRKGSLPPSYEGILSNQGGPPPLPTRPHGAGYENIPGKSTSRPPFSRALTAPESRF